MGRTHFALPSHSSCFCNFANFQSAITQYQLKCSRTSSLLNILPLFLFPTVQCQHLPLVLINNRKGFWWVTLPCFHSKPFYFCDIQIVIKSHKLHWFWLFETCCFQVWTESYSCTCTYICLLSNNHQHKQTQNLCRRTMFRL